MKIHALCLLFLLSILASAAQHRVTDLPFATRSEVIAQHGIACTSQPLATQVAIDILKKGGNAIDEIQFIWKQGSIISLFGN